MKKLKLKTLNLNGPELLTRAQLKNVMGGDLGSGTTCNGYATTSHTCDPCGIDISVSTSDSTICCLKC
jgi:hypothetical protein